MTTRSPSPTSPRRLSFLLLLAVLAFGTLACGAESTEADPAGDAADTPASQTPETPEGSSPDGAAATSEAPEAFDPSTLPDVVATLGDREISRQQLMDEAQAARAQLLQSGVPDAATRSREFYTQALDQIIADELIYQEARREDLLPSDEEVEQRIEALRARVPEGRSFDELLAAQGMTLEGLTEEVRRTAAMQKVLEAKIAPKVSVDDAQARTFYEENLDRMQMPPRVKARHILLEVSQDASEEDRQAARETARNLRSQIEEGADFAALAREHSEDSSSAQQGGELPWLMPGQTVPAFDQAVFSLEPGTLGPVVESRFGYHVIQVLDKQPEQTAPFEQVKDRILSSLREQQTREQLLAHVDELKAAHEVEIHL